MVGKKLSALLQILRNAGVTRYVSGDVTIELGAAPAPRPPRGAVAIDVSPEALSAEDRADEEFEREGDFRYALERLTERHYPSPRRGDPRRNKAPTS